MATDKDGHCLANLSLLWVFYSVNLCFQLSKCPVQNSHLHEWLLWLFFVASGLRILQDFAGICRVKCLIFFVCTWQGRSHNP